MKKIPTLLMGFAISLVFANTLITQSLTIENSIQENKSLKDLNFSPNLFDGCTTTTGQYPAETFTPQCNESEENMTSFLGKYGQFTKVNVTKNIEYTFKNGGSIGFITITDEDGIEILAAKETPLTWKSTKTGVIRYYSHLDENCSSSNTLTSRTIRCNGIVIPEEPVGCLDAPNGQYPKENVIPACDGSEENITSIFGKYGQYSKVDVQQGVEYKFKNGGFASFITISNEDGTEIITSGPSPIVWTATSSGTIRYYSHADENCTVNNIIMTRTVTCSPVVVEPEPSGCLSAPNGQYPVENITPACNGVAVDITNGNGKFGQFAQINVEQDVEYTFTIPGIGGYITITNADGTLTHIEGKSPIVWTATNTETVRFYSHEDENCTVSDITISKLVKCGTTPVIQYDEPDFPCYFGDGAITQIFDAKSVDQAIFTMWADDFEVELGTEFTLHQITMSFLSNSEFSNATLRLYKDLNDLPGELINQQNLTVSTNQNYGYSDYYNQNIQRVEYALNENITLSSGKYWISIETPNQARWITTDQGNSGSTLVFTGDGGNNWIKNSSERFVFYVEGECNEAPVEFEEPDFPCFQGDGEITDFSNGINIAQPENIMVAEDFVVDPDTEFTLRQITMSYLSNNVSTNAIVKIYKNQNGIPGEFLQEENLTLTSSKTYGFNEEYEGGLNAQRTEYVLDNPITLQEGTYWFSIITPNTAYWITTKEGTSGSGFALSMSEGQTWLGPNEDETKFVFYVEGDCEDVDEVIVIEFDEPDYPCYQGDGDNTFMENGYNIGNPEQALWAEDIIVDANTVFTIHQITMSLNSNTEFTDAKVRLYSNNNGKPGQILNEINLTISTHQTYGLNMYNLNKHRIEFKLEEPLPLTEGTYWFSVITPNEAYWVASAQGHSGSNFASSFNNGTTWDIDNEEKFIFYIEGECEEMAVQDLNSVEFAYYPNPVNDILNIKSKYAVKKIQVFNMAGQELRTNYDFTKNILNLKTLSSGVYLIRATLENGAIETFKIIKK